MRTEGFAAAHLVGWIRSWRLESVADRSGPAMCLAHDGTVVRGIQRSAAGHGMDTVSTGHGHRLLMRILPAVSGTRRHLRQRPGVRVGALVTVPSKLS